jgi:preprotein translocase subunit SecD
MQKNLTGKTFLIIGVLLVFLYGIFFGTDPGRSLDAMKKGGVLAGIQQNIHLGLDLRGGTHLILQVMVKDAVNATTDQAVERIQEGLAKISATGATVTKPDPVNAPDKIVINGLPIDKQGAARSFLDDTFSREYDFSPTESGYTVAMKPSVERDLEHGAVTQAIETIRSRVDTLGVSEPVIQEHGLGENQILVQLPGVDDPARVKEIIQSTAMLAIHQVLGGPYANEQEAAQANGGAIPPNAVLLPEIGSQGSDTQQYYLLQRIATVSGNDIRDAQPGRDENNRPDVNFTLTNAGGKRFYDFTSAHVGDKLAVVLDNRIREVANINSAIRDQGQIAGGFNEQSAKDLGMMLRSGALPASIQYREERTVGPSLGRDSIKAGVTAAVIGMVAVLIFMLIYYHAAGINADLALLLNLVVLLGFLGFSGATLTLPGIAGVILTIGMGVDSNVLTFERIREELRAGKAPGAAVDQGFAHAWVTIVDTHVTTIVSAFILFLFGTGPVKGFAVTLTFGLFANLFTAVFVSRVIFDAELKRRPRTLSI